MTQASFSEARRLAALLFLLMHRTSPTPVRQSQTRSCSSGISVGGGKGLLSYFDDSPEGELENASLHLL